MIDDRWQLNEIVNCQPHPTLCQKTRTNTFGRVDINTLKTLRSEQQDLADDIMFSFLFPVLISDLNVSAMAMEWEGTGFLDFKV